MTPSAPPASRLSRRFLASLAALAATLGAWAAFAGTPEKAPAAAPRPALTVSPTTLKSETWPLALAAGGNVAAWQEAVIGAEIGNARLTEVRVNVGDSVHKGQLLARIADATFAAELAQSAAAVDEAAAALAEARNNARRAEQLGSQGFYSPQQVLQFATAETTAAARLEAARARHQTSQVRMAQTQVLAPDAGIVSARNATVGSLAQPGQELFRLIRGGRLEWRAEITAAEIAALRPGMPARIESPSGRLVEGRIRTLAPTVDPATRNALAYVDLPPAAAAAGLRAGSYARGRFERGSAAALTLPQTAVVQRDGFAYVFRLSADGRVAQTKVTLGRRQGERVEILAGLTPDIPVAATGAGFLADGDAVRVVP